MLWAAIECLQRTHPEWDLYVYCDASCDAEMLGKHATSRFNVNISPSSITVVPLTTRHLLSPSRYPRFTMICQAVASLLVSIESLYHLIPEIWVDTTGWAFPYPIVRLFGCKVVAYVHYPTISSDMLLQVKRREAAFNNSRALASHGIFSYLKLVYYQIFGYWYGICGGFSHVRMVNSSWTRDHISHIWWRWGGRQEPLLVYPPCDTIALQRKSFVDTDIDTIVSVAQFRPEKNHEIQIRALQYVRGVAHALPDDSPRRSVLLKAKLLMIGGCRDDGDYHRVETLKAQAADAGLDDSCIEFHINVPFEQLQEMLTHAVAGLHSMKDEHFGISVVEYMAAGAIPIAHNSAGPKGDIVVPEEVDGVMQQTGFLCETVKEYGDAIIQVLEMSGEERMKMRQAARIRSNRFSQERFQQGWLDAMAPLLTPTDPLSKTKIS